MFETWKDVSGYEGLYRISNSGKVYSCRRNKEMRPADSNGYFIVCLCKNSNYKVKSVHRLVAEAFIPNTNNFNVVNHIDGNKKNNRVDNLEWCTQKQNVRHCISMGQFSKMKYRNK